MFIEAQVLTGANVLLNNLKMAGHIKEAELPAIEFISKEVNTSIGKKELVIPQLKPLSFKITFSSVRAADYEFVAQSFKTRNEISIKANLSDDFTHSSFLINAKVAIKKIERPKIAMEEEGTITLEFSAYEYSELIDNVCVFNYSANDGICEINGEDLYAAIRENI